MYGKPGTSEWPEELEQAEINTVCAFINDHDNVAEAIGMTMQILTPKGLGNVHYPHRDSSLIFHWFNISVVCSFVINHTH